MKEDEKWILDFFNASEKNVQNNPKKLNEFYEKLEKDIIVLNKNIFHTITYSLLFEEGQEAIVTERFKHYKLSEKDPNYFSSLYDVSPEGKALYFNETMSHTLIERMLKPGFNWPTPPLKKSELLLMQWRILAIKKGLQVLRQSDSPLMFMGFTLFNLFTHISSIINDHIVRMYNKTSKSSKIIEARKQVTEKTLKKLQKKLDYSKIKKIYNNAKGINDRKSKLDKAIENILGTKDKKTLRKYRNLLIKNFENVKSIS